MTNEFKYEVVEEIAVLSESSKGWTKQLNIVSWNENEPKYDIREWAPDRSKMGKGITFTEEEARMLKMALASREDLE
ncbi:MAG TPA: PC4/YdbC family ssDNA-binding protein [Candidatus Methanomethylophilaceae archaeon]|nr:PC4/YdbC family ssDNA-binding protein [Candidatus Methanomethylophilaceae archaeon]